MSVCLGRWIKEWSKNNSRTVEPNYEKKKKSFEVHLN